MLFFIQQFITTLMTEEKTSWTITPLHYWAPGRLVHFQGQVFTDRQPSKSGGHPPGEVRQMENQPGENDLFSFRLIDMRRLLAPLILRLTVKFPRSLVLSWNPPPVNAQWRLFHHDAIDQSIRMCHCMSLQYQREKIGFASRALHPIVSLRSFSTIFGYRWEFYSDQD